MEQRHGLVDSLLLSFLGAAIQPLPSLAARQVIKSPAMSMLKAASSSHTQVSRSLSAWLHGLLVAYC
jgi:hypothetical protein